MSVKPPRRGGFTLIEMLVVVIIIAILAGMVLGLLKVSGQWAAKAQTNERLGKVRAAIEEFYAEYGKYPPVPIYDGAQPFYYEYPWSNGVNSHIASSIADPTTSWDTCPIFTFGLMSFLVQRYGDEWDANSSSNHAQNVLNAPGGGFAAVFTMRQWMDYNLLTADDTSRDKNAVQRWKTYIKDIQKIDLQQESVSSGGAYTNFVLTVKDGWGKELKYESTPPYQSYKLSSAGPDGNFGTADDISTGPGY